MSGRQFGILIGGLLVGLAVLGSLWLERSPVGVPAPADRFDDRAGRTADIPFDDQQRRVRVEVLNGAGDAGAAARATEALREAGFDVKTYGNAPRFDVEKTFVIARSEDERAARRLAERLGDVEVRSEPEPDLFLDATVVLGADWRERISPP